MRPLAALALVVAACAPAPTIGPSSGSQPPTAPASTVPSAAPDRVAGWIDDLEMLIPEMAAIHPDLGHSTPVAELESAVESLIDRIPASNDDELMVGILRIVALVSAAGHDGHTGAFIWGTGTYPVSSLPLRLWLFPEGVYIVDALPPYEDLVGAKIATVAGHPIADVLAALDPLIPRDNPATVTLLTPRFLLIPEVLHGLELIDDVGPVELGLATGPERIDPTAVEPISMADYNAWAGPYALHLPDDPDVLYLSDAANVLWSTDLGGGTLFVQYNRVERVATSVVDGIEAAAAAPGIERVVVDIRHNYGGETFARSQVLDLLMSDAFSGRQLSVIVGRNTFSAASLFSAEVDARTEARFAGEPEGGSPNLYGNSRDVRLPYSGIVVSVASEYFETEPGADNPYTKLDIPVPLTAADYFAGRDPALEAILAQP
jgi:hypothetical protein